MSQLIVFDGVARMSSVDIADFCEKRHDHVLRDIRVMLENLEFGDCPQNWGEYKDPTGRSLPCAYLDYELMLTLVAGYRVDLRYRIVKRWRELEEGVANVPKTFADALQLAAEQQRQLEEKSRQLTEAAPKVEFYNQVAECGDNYDMKTTAAMLDYRGMGQNNLFDFLRGEGVLQRDKTPYREQLEAGRFEVAMKRYTRRNRVGEDITETYPQTRVTPKGLAYIQKLLDQAGYKPAIERGA